VKDREIDHSLAGGSEDRRSCWLKATHERSGVERDGADGAWARSTLADRSAMLGSLAIGALEMVPSASMTRCPGCDLS
jgi:hypothetical protein